MQATGYEDATHNPVTFVSLTGKGSGFVGIVTVSGGSVTAVTVKVTALVVDIKWVIR